MLLSTLLIISIFMKTPLTLCLSLIALSFFMASLYGIILSKWMGYAILLIFLGGMMVIFLYVSSSSLSDKIMSFETPPMVLFPALAILSVGSLMTQPMNAQFFFSSHLYHQASATILLFLIIYLLSVLFNVVKLTESFKGALLKKW